MSVGWPAIQKLTEFGSQVWSAFGHPPYHVGSSLTGDFSTDRSKRREWFDVDVRLILPDDEYEAWGLGKPNLPHSNGKWISLCWAYSELGRAMTGLPVDFQIQQQTLANEEFPSVDGCLRSALGIIPLRISDKEDDK